MRWRWRQHQKFAFLVHLVPDVMGILSPWKITGATRKVKKKSFSRSALLGTVVLPKAHHVLTTTPVQLEEQDCCVVVVMLATARAL